MDSTGITVQESIRKPLKFLDRLNGFSSADPAVFSGRKKYLRLQRNITLLMFCSAMIPLLFVELLFYFQYESPVRHSEHSGISVEADRVRQDYELFLQERLSGLRSLAAFYGFEQLSDSGFLAERLQILKEEFKGFEDLGVLDHRGLMRGYAGPYSLEDRDFSNSKWFQKISREQTCCVRASHAAQPLFILSVRTISAKGESWFVRAAILPEVMTTLASPPGLDTGMEVLLTNRSGILQTPSIRFGPILNKLPFHFENKSEKPGPIETVDIHGEKVQVGYSRFREFDYVLLTVRSPLGEKTAWSLFSKELLLILLVSGGLIYFLSNRLAGAMIQRIQHADEKKDLAFRELEHSHKLSSIGRLAAGVAHEINNPLAIINQKVGLIRDLIECSSDGTELKGISESITDITRSPDCKIYRLSDEIVNAVVRCRSITHRLLYFSSRMEPSKEAMDLNELIREVLRVLNHAFLERQARVDLDLADDLPLLHADRGLLQQALFNIFNNAVEAIPVKGKILVSTRLESVKTGDLEQLEGSGTVFVINIEDNGEGISRENLEHIFEPFFSTRMGYGTGLGLSITYGIIQKQGGWIQVESELRKGTRFSIFLPLQTVSSKTMP